ncbi:MAG: hypothetical protein B6D35_14395 [Candidatus Brocadia sp. UTAMX2]|jgi:type I restriction enzyme S subunit|nr:MAG: hypothetical protein B6D35_14395 [Candidatus Brocadia sp. UTAMX2]
MSNLPKGWETAMLNDLLISLESGSRPKGGVRGIQKGTPSIGGEHLSYDGTFDFSSIKYVPEEFAKNMSKGNIRLNDILIVKDGATTGKTAFVDEHFPFKNAVVNEHVFVCRPSPLIEPRFIFRFLMSKEGQERILENFQGSAQGGINLSFAPNTEISFAPLNEQCRIVAKLEKLLHRVDACKERLEKIPAILKRFRQSVLAAACSGRLTEDWREKNPNVEIANILLERIKVSRTSSAKTKIERNKILKFYEEGKERLKQKDNEIDLPETWGFCEINNLGDVCNGSTPSRKKSGYWSGNIPWISSGEVRNNVITKTRETITKEGYENSSVRLLHIGTVLLAMIGEGKTRGQTAILDIEATINQNIAAVILDHGLISSKYLWYWFQLQYEITRQVGSGSGPQALNCQRVRALPFYLPPLPEQHEIVRRVDALFKKADEIEARYKKAKTFVDKLSQSILAKAFRGELVPQDPNDEPASVLLERIKVERAKQESKKREKRVAYDT